MSSPVLECLPFIPNHDYNEGNFSKASLPVSIGVSFPYKKKIPVSLYSNLMTQPGLEPRLDCPNDGS